jgi:hypothetical protein
VAEMAGALGIPAAALRGQMSCLAIALGAAPGLAEVQAGILAALVARLGRPPMAAPPDDGELALAGRLLRDEIGTDDYVLGDHARAAVEVAPEVAT